MKLSIIIPFYNMERFLHESLSSVLKSFDNLVADSRFSQWCVEIICIDDGSTDRTGELLDRWREESSQGRPNLDTVVLHQKNGGEGAARNTGLANVHGDYVMFFDGDDLLGESALLIGAEQIVANPNADILSFQFQRFYDGTPFAFSAVPHQSIEFDLTQRITGAVVENQPLWATFYKNEIVEGLLFAKLKIGADRLFVAECLGRAGKLVVSSDVIYGYRRSSSSISRKLTAQKIIDLNGHFIEIWNVLLASGKELERDANDFLAGSIAINMPERIRRMADKHDILRVFDHWKDTLVRAQAYPLTKAQKRICRILLFLTAYPAMALTFARCIKKAKPVLFSKRPVWNF